MFFDNLKENFKQKSFLVQPVQVTTHTFILAYVTYANHNSIMELIKEQICFWHISVETSIDTQFNNVSFWIHFILFFHIFYKYTQNLLKKYPASIGTLIFDNIKWLDIFGQTTKRWGTEKAGHYK